MSKTTKFLSIGIDMYKEARGKERDPERKTLNANDLEKALIAFEDYLKHKGELYTKEPEGKKGVFELTVTEDFSGVISEVRLYPVKPGESLTSEYEANGRVDFYRFVTNRDGKLSESLPVGKYLVKVSKGSEYEIEYFYVDIKEDTLVESEVSLKRFADLSKEGFFAGDIHHHSIFSSPVWGGDDDVKESPLEVAESMQAMGLRFGALSDHHNILNHKEWKATENEDFYPIVSKEISTSNGHVLSLGVENYDVIYKIPKDEDRTDEYLRNEFVRITDEIRDHKGLPQLNHPRDLSKSISWNPDFYDMTEVFETIEIWNGSNPMYTGSTDWMAAKFWRDLLEEGRWFPVTTGSDTHNIKANDYHVLTGKLYWFLEKAKEYGEGFINECSEWSYLFKSFLNIGKEFLPFMEVWAKTCLTSGCVRTYIELYKNEKLKTDSALNALRSGHSFITNGPILDVHVNGEHLGGIVEVKNGSLDLDIRLLSNRKVTKLVAFLSNKKAVEIPIKDLPTAKSYDYSFELKDFKAEDSSYIFFAAYSDATNLAITNAFRLKH